MTNPEELERVEAIAANSRYAAGVNAVSVAYAFEVFRRHVASGPILEMGPAEGVMTDRLVTLGEPLTVVEGGKPFCESIEARHPTVEVVHSLFEDFEPNGQFRTIILGHVLEHVQEPVAILRRAANWLAEDGKLIASVPNARSIHRQAAVTMGLLDSEDALNEADRTHGHRRVYDPESFRADFADAGLRVETFGGYWLKPLSNAQIEASFTPAMLDAFMQLGERYPEIAGEIYIVAGR